jgi:CBS domain-containing protein
MTAGEVCNREVVIASADETIAQAARRIRACHVGTLVVVDDREGTRTPVGILTDRDIVIHALADKAEPLYALRIGSVMSSNLVTAGEHESLPDVLKKMRSYGVRRIPIVNEDGGLEGILAFDDVVELLAEELSDLAGLIAREQTREREVRV